MGSSLYLSGGVQSTDRLVKTIGLSSTFKIGDVVRFDLASGQYTKAQANSAINSEVVGVVSAVNPTNFVITMNGQIDDLSSLSYLAGTTAPVLFLSGSTAGQVTPFPPSAIGSVIKPILIRNQTSQTYVVNNFLGTQIGGSSTVSIDQIQPVGTIVPFSGSVIPDTWLPCNGASYGIVDYPDLYNRIRYQTGDQVPLYGYVATVTFGSTWVGNVTVGDIVIGNQANSAPTVAAHDFMGRVLAKPTTTTLTIQFFPRYDPTTKTFSVQNKQVVANSYFLAYTDFTYGTVRSGNGNATGTPSLTHFNTPDLRARFPLGINDSSVGEKESDAAYISALGAYGLGAYGGQEQISVPPTSVTVTGSLNNVLANFTNNVMSNMPPYIAFTYIIKAKPYTRAAIIDGVDLPYDRFLVRDSKTNTMLSEMLSGLSGGDLVLYTNSGETSKLGTERMRLTNGGSLGIGTDYSSQPQYGHKLRIFGTGTTYGSNPSYPDVLPSNISGLNGILLNGGKSETSSTGLLYESGNGGGAGVVFSRDYGYGTYISFATNSDPSAVNAGRIIERIRIDRDGNLGIGTTGPGATLDVNGRVNFTSASTDFGAANRANLVVGNGIVAGFRQLQFGVSDTHNCAWISGWLNGVGGQTLAIQPMGGRLFIGATASTFSGDPTTAVGIYGDLTLRETNLLMNVDFRTRANSGWGRGVLFTDGFSPAQSGSYAGVTAGIGLHGSVTNAVSTPDWLYMAFGSSPWASNRGLYVRSDGKVGIGTYTPSVALDINGEARSSTSTTAASNAKTLVTKDYLDLVSYTFTYGNTTYSTTGYTNQVGSWNDNSNYFDVLPPSGKAMSNLVAFIPSIAVIHYAGGVNGDDSLRCTWTALSDRIRVYVQNTEQRSIPAANWLAIWR